jgi:transcriptional regulator GlxA family with amidase domain
MPTIAILTFDGFNEIDSFVALNILGRVSGGSTGGRALRPLVTCPTARVTSLNGVTVDAQAPLEAARDAEAVLIGSGRRTREIAANPEILGRLSLDPRRQLVGSQCSGALIAFKLGLLGDMPACADRRTRPWLEEAGVRVLDQSFTARGNIATAGGCMSSVLLATWFAARLAGEEAARDALSYVAPVGEENAYIERALSAVHPTL